MVFAWACRLGSFLFIRVLKEGGDKRFDKVRGARQEVCQVRGKEVRGKEVRGKVTENRTRDFTRCEEAGKRGGFTRRNRVVARELAR